ncbi:MAG: SIS domain-containing protein [bacterium]|nr:SIS domain-containing protein [bacterium]
MLMLDDIAEQPQVLNRILEDELSNIISIGQIARERGSCLVMAVGRGSSNNVAMASKYIFETIASIPSTVISPTILMAYQARLNLSNAVVIGISRSGETYETREVLRMARELGAMTVAITEEPESPLGLTADYCINTRAGVEKAISSTKTYTAQMAILYLLAAVISEDRETISALRLVPELMNSALTLSDSMCELVKPYRYMTRCVVLGNGFNYATALETALKLEEICQVSALSHSSAEFAHAAISLVGEGYPVMIFVPGGPTYNNMLRLTRELQRELGAETIVISDRKEVLEIADTALVLPEPVREVFSPLVFMVVGQLFAYNLALQKGLNPDRPRGRRKIVR